MFAEKVRNGVVVVAHPDDETLWAGGLLIRYPERWTVICCSIPRADPERTYKFFAACESLGAKARLLPYQESETEKPLGHLDLLDLSEFDCVLTHNAAGEYGHFHHRHLHQYIVVRWREKTATFGWTASGQGSEILRLTADERDRKISALKCYDHISRNDSKPKWQALIDRYALDLRIETFNPAAG